MPGRGLEPPQPCGHNDLNVTRIPFRHPGLLGILPLLPSLAKFRNNHYNKFMRKPCVKLASKLLKWLDSFNNKYSPALKKLASK